MTDKQQPDPLALADEAWNFDCSKYRGARHANAAMMGKMQDCADMIRKLHAELERLALYKSLADEYGLSIFPDIAEMTAELETLRAGYTAARMEIDSLKSQVAPAQAAPEGWVTWWPSPSAAGHEPVYSHGPKEPGYGAKLDAMLRKYPVFAAPTTQPAPAAQGDALDAARWRALLACGRIRIIGTAGVTGTGAHDPKALDPNKQPYGNYVHFGAEFWSTFPDQDYYNTKENPTYARATLTEFADAARAAQEGKSHDN